MFIHPTALVSKSVKLHDDIYVGPYSIIEDNVILGKNIRIDSHVVLKQGTILEDNVKVHSFACIGGEPQILIAKENICSGVKIGSNTVVREGVTIHKASGGLTNTIIGENCYLMAYCHVGHDCKVGSGCILANNSLLAGCVVVGDNVFVSGGAKIHQFVHVGENAFLSGDAAITMHIPPYVTVIGRNVVCNLNVVGLQRRKFTSAEVADIKQCYRQVFMQNNMSFKKNAETAISSARYKTDKGKLFLDFFVQEMPIRGFVSPNK